MNYWKKIEDCLWDEGFDVMNENGSIFWKSEKGKHSIKSKDVAVDGNKLAWYQDEEYGKCWIRILKANGVVINWKLASNHSDFGFKLHYMKWFANKLIVMYSEKSGTHIVKIEDITVTDLYIGSINKIHIKEDCIYIHGYPTEEFYHYIQVNAERTLLNCLPIANLNNPAINVELDSFDLYIMKLEEGYNKS